VSRNGVWLDTSISAHEVDNIAYSKELESQGYEVWLQTPVTSKVKPQFRPWKNQVNVGDLVRFRDADKFIFVVSSFLIDYLKYRWYEEFYGSRGPRSNSVFLVKKFIDLVPQGQIEIFLTDPRKSFRSLFLDAPGETRGGHVGNEKVGEGRDHGQELLMTLRDSRIVTADKSVITEEIPNEVEVSSYWKFVEEPVCPWSDKEKEFFLVYPGMGGQSRKRKKTIGDWIGDRDNCFTMGEINISGIPSLSGYQNCGHSEVISVTRECTTSLVCGEPQHSWLTPRVIQSFTQGTIASIHPDFGGRHLIPDEILEDQTFETSRDFDMKLCRPEIYQRQLDFVRDLSHL
jgi:hypothetical protein